MKTIQLGDNLETILLLADNSIDSVVTDPPYGFSFMGKAWDYDVPGVDLWRQCLRVLKPGGYLLSFCGARTYHRLVCNIEDAGFEIRDQLAWIYGSGFPKNLDLARAIDAADGPGKQRERQLRFTSWMRSTGLTSGQINQATNTSMGGHYLTDKEQPAIATREHLEKLRPLIGEVPAWIEEMCDQRSAGSDNLLKRKPRSIKKADMTAFQNIGGESVQGLRLKTKAHTDQAREWEGWGTALKPAHEPIVLARKPFKGTVAENVMQHRTGGLNIGGCRISLQGETPPSGSAKRVYQSNAPATEKVYGDNTHTPEEGRFPANVLHDGSPEVLELFARAGGSGAHSPLSGREQSSATKNAYNPRARIDAADVFYGDQGSAARFFYQAKTTKRDRDEGLKAAAIAGNHHPTVKPTALMAYLCRLVTPPGGTILDPFAGSGSTGKGAILEGFNVVLLEREAEYLPLIEARTTFAEETVKNAKQNRGLSALELALLLDDN